MIVIRKQNDNFLWSPTVHVLYINHRSRKGSVVTSLTRLCEYEVSSAVLRASVAIALRLHRAEHCDCVCVCVCVGGGGGGGIYPHANMYMI